MKAFFRKIWDAIVSFIGKVPKDKLLHFIAGLVIAAFAALVLGMKACFIPALFAGLLKEFFDLWTTDKWDWGDIVATLAGGLVIFAFALM